MTKDDKAKRASLKSGGNQAPQQNKPQLKCILHFKDPKPNDKEIKAKFYEADDSEVSEQIMCYKTGDVHANLVILMDRMVGLGDLYDMWNDGDSRKLGQSLHRALSGQVKKDWQRIMGDVVDWDNIDKEEFIRLLKQLAKKTFGPKAFKQQCKVMDDGKIKIPSNSTLRNGAQRFFQINLMLPYLGEFAREYTTEELNKIITKSLPPKAYGKYCGDGGDDLDDEDEILELLSMIDTKLDLKAEVAFLERKENPKLNNSDRKSDGNKKGKQSNGGEGGKSKEDKAKPCFKHDGKHDWRDCPDNKNRRPQSESKKEKDKVPKKDLHSTKGSDESKKTPMVKVADKSEINNRYKDLAYDTDDGSIMMVQKTASKQTLNGITVIAVPGADGTQHGTTILLDNGFTGFAMMSHPFAKSLGYEFQRGEGESYRTVAGTMEMNISVTVKNVRLPALSHNRTFTATFEIAPQESGDFGYGVIMGVDMMDYLGIDQSRTDKIITWGRDIEVPMVPNGYWTEAHIQTICQQLTKAGTKGEESTDTPSTVNFTEDLFLTKQTKASFKKAFYETPDLLEIAKRDGTKLTSAQNLK